MEGSPVGVESVFKGRGELMIQRIRKSLTLKWMVFFHLLFLARDENFRKAGPSHTKGHLENILYQNDYLVELTLLNEKGQEIIKVSKYEVVGPSDLKNQSKSEIFGMASKGKTYFGDFHLTSDLVPTMVISVPIEEYKGEPVGVLKVVDETIASKGKPFMT